MECSGPGERIHLAVLGKQVEHGPARNVNASLVVRKTRVVVVVLDLAFLDVDKTSCSHVEAHISSSTSDEVSDHPGSCSALHNGSRPGDGIGDKPHG